MLQLLALASALAAGSSLPAKPVVFPAHFKWCVATSAHQIEGANVDSDWWAWEQLPGKTKARSGAACDHWNRVDEDIALMRELGVQAYRFSIEWAKIEPREGQWNAQAVEHYRQELAALRAAGIEPMVTLLHFTLPAWLADKGGLEYERFPELFARFAAYAVAEIGPDVRDWMTLNEPMVQLFDGYVLGLYPPGRNGGIPAAYAPMLGLLRAHAAAYHAMHAVAARPGHAPIRVGVAHHLRVFDPPQGGWHPIDSFLAGKFSTAFNWAFSGALETGHLKFDIPFTIDKSAEIPEAKGTQDFIGVNYYSRDIVRLDLKKGFSLSVPKGAPTSDLGWELYPEGFYRILKSVAKRFPGKPIIITENGIADSRDAKRSEFLDAHLRELARAIGEGLPIEAYCHWSLLDNFEWQEGFGPRFGLYEVDFATQKRTARESARHFAEIIRTRVVR